MIIFHCYSNPSCPAFSQPQQKLPSKSSPAEAGQTPRGLHLGPHSILGTHHVLQIPALDAEVEGISKGRETKFMSLSLQESAWLDVSAGSIELWTSPLEGWGEGK